MLLNKLRDYETAQGGGVPDYYRVLPVRWAYHLDKKKWERLGTDEAQPELAVPAVKRTNAGTPQLVADTAEYVFGMSEADRAERAAKYRALYLDLLTKAAAVSTGAAKVLAAVGALRPPPGMTPVDRLAFYDRGRLVTDEKALQDFWAELNAAGFTGGPPVPCTCCGAVRRAIRKSPEWIRGVPEALKRQCVMITGNNQAAERYGRAGSTGAGVCYPCVRDVTRGLNRLVAGETAFELGPLMVIHWGSDVPVADALLAPAPDTAAILRAGAWAGEACVLVITGRQSRLVVRSFWAGPAAELAGRLADWLEPQAGAPCGLLDGWREAEGGKKYRAGGVLNLLHPLGEVKKVPVGTVAAVVETVLEGVPLPYEVRQAAEYVLSLGRDVEKKFEKRPNPLPVAAAMLTAAGRFTYEGGDMTGKVHTADTPAYRCGQLLGELERTQKAAIPRINRTVADTVLRTAATNPRAVLGEAMTDAKAHISKLERQNRAGPYRDAINACVEGLDVPERFTAEDQAAFALGYYSVALARPARAAEKEPAGA